MSKLIIPAAELIGTPLTQEELKGIIAGYSINRVCQCSYTRSGPLNGEGKQPKYFDTLTGVKNSAECDGACASQCNNDLIYKCVDYQYTFTTTETGPR